MICRHGKGWLISQSEIQLLLIGNAYIFIATCDRVLKNWNPISTHSASHELCWIPVGKWTFYQTNLRREKEEDTFQVVFLFLWKRKMQEIMNTEKHVRGVLPTLRFNKKLIRLIRKLKRRKYYIFLKGFQWVKFTWSQKETTLKIQILNICKSFLFLSLVTKIG